jgi:hypothetical protein
MAFSAITKEVSVIASRSEVVCLAGLSEEMPKTRVNAWAVSFVRGVFI